MISKFLKKYFPRADFLSFIVPLTLINTVVSLIITFPVFTSGYQGAFLLNLIPFVAHFFLLNLVAGIVTGIIAFFAVRWLTAAAGIVLFSLIQLLLLVDTRIYTIFHYHINALVLNVLTTAGATDSVIIGRGTIAAFAGLCGLIIIAEVVSCTLLRKKGGTAGSPALTRISKALFVISIGLVLLDKGIYAYGDLFNNTTITKSAKLFPLYQTFTIKRFAADVLHVRVNRESGLKISHGGSAINYPKETVRFDAARNERYNMIVIVADGLRFDMLTPEVMPKVSAFAEGNVVYRNHYSGGNGTRFGLFTLLYGIHGAYWHNFLAFRVSPVLIDSLIDKGYDFKILSSTRLTFPEFRKTAFIRIPESIEDTFTTEKASERDRITTEKLLQFISAGKRERPFFAFLFLNSSHQPFLYPPEFGKFQPAGPEEINYFTTIGKDKADLIRNRYKNSILYSDHLIGDILDKLKSQDLLKSTIVVICGDHGEEFYENGYFGHTSSFDDYQLKTVFVLHYPGQKPRTVERLTSHMDLVPTLLDSLGSRSPAEDYSQGISLLSNAEHPYVMVANWDTAAIIDADTKIVYSTESYNVGTLEVRRKADYALVENAGQSLKQKKSLIMDILTRMSEFYKKS